MIKDANCPVCISSNRVVKQNDSALAILSNPRKTPGHFLIAPKRHIVKPWQMSESELKDVFSLLFFIEQKLVTKLGEGADIRQNYRPYIPANKLKQDHVLFHLYPRYYKDYLWQVSEKFETDLFTDLDSGETEEFVKLLSDD